LYSNYRESPWGGRFKYVPGENYTNKKFIKQIFGMAF
jgi:hypothetical protein